MVKLSIKNFKTIKELKDYEFNPINVISGVNSSGKTSLIQFLLLIKQTLEAEFNNPDLKFKGDLVNLGNYEKIVYNKDIKNEIEFNICFDEINQEMHGVKIKYFCISIKYCSNGNKNLYLKEFTLKCEQSYPKTKMHTISFSHTKKMFYKVKTDTLLFGEFKEQDLQGELKFNSFIPISFDQEIKTNGEPRTKVEIKNLDYIYFFKNFFKNISYIGPLREDPKELYYGNSNSGIGVKGEYTAYILDKELKNRTKTEFYKMSKIGSICNKRENLFLIEAVKYWLCNIFKLANNVYAKPVGNSYAIEVTNCYNVVTTVDQVGFGISQVLPIIVEGLRMSKSSILIIEQPEIHLHPKVQSCLFDFIYSLSSVGKKFLIETHSENFITRMRRRCVESNKNLHKNINFVFVEQKDKEHVFRRLDLDNMGTIDYFPENFLEQTDDNEAIVIAQANKYKKANDE